MSKKEQGIAPSMDWLVEGTTDTYANYVDRPRSDLPMADLSDDALANAVFMYADKGFPSNEKLWFGEPIPRAYTTAAKERICWLARQLAVAEGKYPGIPKPGFVEMPELAGVDACGDVTVTPEWAAWYEDTFGADAGSGYIKGQAMLKQHSRVQLAVFSGNAMDDRIDASVTSFSSVEEAKSVFAVAEAPVDYFVSSENKRSCCVDGIFSVDELEALAYLARHIDPESTSGWITERPKAPTTEEKAIRLDRQVKRLLEQSRQLDTVLSKLGYRFQDATTEQKAVAWDKLALANYKTCVGAGGGADNAPTSITTGGNGTGGFRRGEMITIATLEPASSSVADIRRQTEHTLDVPFCGLPRSTAVVPSPTRIYMAGDMIPKSVVTSAAKAQEEKDAKKT